MLTHGLYSRSMHMLQVKEDGSSGVVLERVLVVSLFEDMLCYYLYLYELISNDDLHKLQ